MQYRVQTIESCLYRREYSVEADSPEDAAQAVEDGDGEEIDSEFMDCLRTDASRVLDDNGNELLDLPYEPEGNASVIERIEKDKSKLA